MLLQLMSVVGALMVLAAYGLNQGGVWRELHTGYLTLNIVGSLMLGVVAIADQRAGFICWSSRGPVSA
jgi:fluoride ion exporter CrcB/FEX